MLTNRELMTRIPLLICAAALLAAACGGSSNSPKSASESTQSSRAETSLKLVDACQLVTKPEASAAVGADVSKLESSAGAQLGGLCYYASADGSAYVVVYAIVFPDTKTAKSTRPEQIAAAMTGAFGLSNAKSVSGIGESAIEYSTTGNANTAGTAIYVVKSNAVLMIAIQPSSSSTTIEKLARTAVGRI